MSASIPVVASEAADRATALSKYRRLVSSIVEPTAAGAKEKYIAWRIAINLKLKHRRADRDARAGGCELVHGREPR